MKKIHSISYVLLTIIFTIKLQAQCPPASAEATLEGNNMAALVSQAGFLFLEDSGDAGYGISESSSSFPGVKTIFAGGVWLGGFDAGDNLKLAANTYGLTSGDTDYFPGPLDSNGETTLSSCENWDRFWETGEEDISSFITDWADGTLDDPIPSSVLGWPGRGNPHFFDLFGFDLPNLNYSIAPFEDVNNDGIYDPNDGDYPDVKGATKATFWVFNDAGNIHTETQGEPLKMEIHALAYAYESTEETINNTTFYELRSIYKGSESLRDSYLGLWLDPDLGCHTDDYIGSDIENELVYVYNQDAQDGSDGCLCPIGISTFCEEIPVVGIKMLHGARAPKIFGTNGQLENPAIGENADTLVTLGLSKFMYHNNGGVNPEPPTGTGDPDIPFEYYNYLSGKFKDGTPLTTGGNGYNIGSTDVVDYAFPDSPDDPNGWSMCAENLVARDRRITISSGPFRLDPGSINIFSFAIIHVPNVPHPCPSINSLVDASELIEDVYNNGITTSVETLDRSLNISVMPNPFSSETQLNFSDLENEIAVVEIYNISGKVVRVYDDISGTSLTIRKENFGSGMYFYKVKTKDDRFHSGKLIVQ